MIPGVLIPVWREHRYLPLVLRQAMLCPGPVVIRWQDRPWLWTAQGEPPSGWNSPVREALAAFERNPRVEIQKVDRDASEEATIAACIDRLRQRGAEVFLRLDSDWLFTYADMDRIYVAIKDSVEPKTWGCFAWHYYRDFRHAMGAPTMGLTLEQFPGKTCDAMLPVMMYHPAYVHTDAEVYEKVNSWGHALEFKERGFYEKEWLAKDDRAVLPYECPGPPEEILRRLRQIGVL